MIENSETSAVGHWAGYDCGWLFVPGGAFHAAIADSVAHRSTACRQAMGRAQVQGQAVCLVVGSTGAGNGVSAAGVVADGSTQCRRTNGDDQFVIRFFGVDLLGRIYRREMIWPGISWATPMAVVGQPALRSALPGSDECLIAVALTDDQGFDIRIDEKGVDPCVHATSAVETVMHNLGA